MLSNDIAGISGKYHGDPISNFAVLVINLAQDPSLGERWSQIRLQQSLLGFNDVVIIILFDFLVELQQH